MPPTKARDLSNPPGLVSRELGSRIRQARLLAGLKQRQLATRVGVETIQVSRWERGEQEPSISRLEAIARTLGQPVSFFFGEPDPPLSEQQLETLIHRMVDEVQDLLDRHRRERPRGD